MTMREEFLQRVRDAVRAGNRAGLAAAVVPRGQVGYQGAGDDPVGRFCAEFTTAGGIPYLVPNRSAAVEKVLELVQLKAARRILLGGGPLLGTLGLAERLEQTGASVIPVTIVAELDSRERLFEAELAITGANALIAESGTLAVFAALNEPRSLTLLPPVHVVVAEQSQIVPDLFDLFAKFESRSGDDLPVATLPSCLTLITGPSKTGDIELKLVTGVHGPGEVHLVLIEG
ncbi:MAG TPA: lactate utilization protein [Gemmataceae bacterium]|nr:lactate utilization protein [Gemmataceae bacterium]